MQQDWIEWRDETARIPNSYVAGNGSTVFKVGNDFLFHAVTGQAKLLDTIHAIKGGEYCQFRRWHIWS
ncbi:hypothetical protein A8H39_28525 [Paraburkholderia fungorum]|nr:hypothetical protein A8H39_28525 [Paraburkholderia fungorum]